MRLLRAIFNRRKPIPFEPFRPRLGLSEREIAAGMKPQGDGVVVVTQHRQPRKGASARLRSPEA